MGNDINIRYQRLITIKTPEEGMLQALTDGFPLEHVEKNKELWVAHYQRTAETIRRGLEYIEKKSLKTLLDNISAATA